MAIYRCSVSSISRGQGRSAVAAAAYRSGEELHSDYTGLTHDYRGKHYIEKKEILLPEKAPSEWLDRETLWNSVEVAERSSDGKLATEVMVALPRELNQEQREKLVYDFCDDLRKKGMVVDYALHCPPDMDDLKRPVDEFGFPTTDPSKMQFNPHSHIMIPIRPLDNNGNFIKSKSTSEYLCKNPATGETKRLIQKELTENEGFEKLYPCMVDGEKVYLTPTELKKRNIERTSRFPLKTRHGRPNLEYSYRMSKNFVTDIRKSWENFANEALAAAGVKERIDCRSYKDQGSAKIAEL